MSNTQQLFSSGKSRGEGQEKADHMMDSVHNTASNVAQSAQQNKEHAAGFMQQTGEQVMQMAHGATDAVKNAVGMGDSNANASGGTTTTTTHRH